MSEISYYSEEGFKNLKEELERLKFTERPKVTREIAEARDKGDLSENAEYDAAKEAQGMLEMRISGLESKMRNARLIDESLIDNSKVLVLSIVRLMNLKLKKEFTFTLVAENEANVKTGKISVNSPIGKGLLGLKVGDIAQIEVPSGIMEMEILEISR